MDWKNVIIKDVKKGRGIKASLEKVFKNKSNTQLSEMLIPIISDLKKWGWRKIFTWRWW